MSCECPTFELPCEAAAGESFAQGGDHPSPPSLTPHFPQSPIQRRQGSSPAPAVVSSRGPAPAVVSSRGRSRPLPPLRGPQGKYGGMRGREVPPRRPSVPCDRHHSTSALVVCEHPAALRSIRCWVVPGRDSSSSASSVRRVPSLHSAVSLRLVYTWPLFLQALCLFRLVRGPRYAAVRARLQSHKAFRAARRQASRLLAQTVSGFRCAPPATDCAGATVPGFASNAVPRFGQ